MPSGQIKQLVIFRDDGAEGRANEWLAHHDADDIDSIQVTSSHQGNGLLPALTIAIAYFVNKDE